MMIRVADLKKNYGPAVAVDGVSFEVSAGEVVGFLGPNGAGKTTTMRMVTGLIGMDGGIVEIDGKPINEQPEESKAKIGYLPENNPLYEDMSVVEYLAFIGEMRGLDPELRKQRIDRNLTDFGLREVATKDIGELSKGYRQRVGLAQASLADPPILILDEPTSGLDPNQIVEIRNLIKKIGKTKTVILSTHNLSEVAATCSRAIIINKGRIVADNTVDALSAEGPKAVLHARIKTDGDPTEALSGLAGIANVASEGGGESWRRFALSIDASTSADQAAEALFDLAVQNGWKLSELSTESVSLETVFTQLTKG
jgi:gliding motility-associated transport system ATP-binding protein